jgi:hypothetical protein
MMSDHVYPSQKSVKEVLAEVVKQREGVGAIFKTGTVEGAPSFGGPILKEELIDTLDNYLKDCTLFEIGVNRMPCA